MPKTFRLKPPAWAVAFLLAAPAVAAPAPFATGTVKGTFVLAGVEAHLTHARAERVKLGDEGAPGYAVVLAAREPTGEIAAWRSAEPSKAGSHIYLLLEADGSVYVAEISHESAQTPTFGVVTEVKKVSFEVEGDRIAGHVRTVREESFNDPYSLDLTFEASLEGK
jgi:hypothetical protein